MTAVTAASPARCGARVYRGSGQVIATGTPTAVIYTIVDHDPIGMWSTAHKTRLTAPIDGYYYVMESTAWNVAGGFASHQIMLNGGDPLTYTYTALPNSGPAGTTAFLSKGDYIENIVQQDSGGNLSLLSYGRASLVLAMHRLT